MPHIVVADYRQAQYAADLHLNAYPPNDIDLSIQQSVSRNSWDSGFASERAKGRGPHGELAFKLLMPPACPASDQ